MPILHGKARLFGLILVLAGCTVAPPYDQAIDDGAQKLRGDFLNFVSERQRQFGTPAGLYSANASTYGGFLAQLGAIQLRAADQPDGVSCKQVTDLFTRVHTGLSSFDAGSLPADGESCIVVLSRIAAQQIELMRQSDERRCASAPATLSCQDLFGRESIATMVASVHAASSVPNLTTAADSSPLVRAVLVSIDQLAGAEQDLKAAAAK